MLPLFGGSPPPPPPPPPRFTGRFGPAQSSLPIESSGSSFRLEAPLLAKTMAAPSVLAVRDARLDEASWNTSLVDTADVADDANCLVRCTEVLDVAVFVMDPGGSPCDVASPQDLISLKQETIKYAAGK